MPEPIPRPTVSVARRMFSAAFGMLAVTAFVLGSATSAEAHNYLVSSTPKIGSTITELPKQFVITTNDNLLNLGGSSNGFFIEVNGPDGLYYGDGCVTVQGPSILMDAALGPEGSYTLLWQVISTDGHTVSSDFTFTWKPDSATQSSEGSATVPDCHGTITSAKGSSPKAQDDAQGEADNDDTLADILWIGGAFVAVGVAAVITVLVLSRPKKKGRPDKKTLK